MFANFVCFDFIGVFKVTLNVILTLGSLTVIHIIYVHVCTCFKPTFFVHLDLYFRPLLCIWSKRTKLNQKFAKHDKYFQLYEVLISLNESQWIIPYLSCDSNLFFTLTFSYDVIRCYCFLKLHSSLIWRQHIADKLFDNCTFYVRILNKPQSFMSKLTFVCVE